LKKLFTELFALLISCLLLTSHAHLSSHMRGYQSDLALQVLPESPQIYNSARMRRHHPYTGAEGKSCRTLMHVRSLCHSPGLGVTGPSRRRDALLEQRRSHPVPRSVCGSLIARNQREHMPGDTRGQGSRHWCLEKVMTPRNNHKADFTASVLLPTDFLSLGL